MRLLISLEATADAAYRHTYHHKLRGRLWKALRGTQFEEEHDNNQPLGMAFSNIFPWGDIQAGDERTVIVASPREPLLTAIAGDLNMDPTFDIGDMRFRVTDVTPLSVDVGEPGERGTIQTDTGVFVRLKEEHRQQYGIEAEGDARTYWRPKHTIEPFRDAITANLQHKHDLFAPDYQEGPEEVDGDLFDSYELIKTYALPVTVTTGEQVEYVVSKWELGYHVQSDAHRQHLNLALDTGIGVQNGLGFGFINITNDAQ